MKDQYIHMTSDVFDNNLIEEWVSHIKIVAFHKRIIFTEKLPSHIKKLNLSITSVVTSVIGIFDDIDTLHLEWYFQEIVEILKTNTKLKKFSCLYYDSINLDELPQSITTIKNYQKNYCGSFDRIMTLKTDLYEDLILSDILPFINLKSFKFTIQLDENVYYDNSKIELISFDTKNNFRLKLANVKDLQLYIYTDNIKELNESFAFLFENCPNIEKLYVVLYSKTKIEERVIINTTIKDFTLNLVDSQINNFNITINGFKKDGHKKWQDNRWQYDYAGGSSLIASVRGDYNNSQSHFFGRTGSLCHHFTLIESPLLTHVINFKTPTKELNFGSSYESLIIETDTNQLTESIKFDREYSSLKPNSEEYILVLRIRDDEINQNILLKMFDILLQRAQTLIPNKNDVMDFRTEYYVIVLGNLFQFECDVEERYKHYGLLTEEIFDEFGFLSLSSIVKIFASVGRHIDEYH